MSIQRVAKGHYIVRWKFPDGRHPKRRIRGTSDREAQREAQAVHVELQKQARMGAFGDGTPSRMLLGEWCAEWARAERRRWSPSLTQKRLQRMAVWVEPYIGRVPLAFLDERRLREWHEEISAEADRLRVADERAGRFGRTRATQIDHAWRDVSAALGAALLARKIPRNPALGARPRVRPRVDIDSSTIRRTLTAREVEMIRAELRTDRDACLVSTLAYAGMRPEEALALCWSDVTSSHIRVRLAYTHGALGPPKTPAARRSIPMIAPLAADLSRLRPRERGADALVFPAARGGFLDLHNWRERIWHPARIRAGVARATPYDLRHTYASLLIHELRAPVLVAKWMGHRKPSLVLDTYAHDFEDAGELPAAKPMIEAISEARGIGAELPESCPGASASPAVRSAEDVEFESYGRVA